MYSLPKFVFVFALLSVACKETSPGDRPNTQTPSLERIQQPRNAAPTTGRVLASRFAGSWYPGSAAALTQMLKGFWSKVTIRHRAPVMALISPHAGYRYSGQTAAHGMARLDPNRIRTVIAIGPSHRHQLNNHAVVPGADYIKTPLGRIALDTAVLSRLTEDQHISTNDAMHQEEHSLQMQYPLLQHALNHFKLVPLLVGQLNSDTVLALARRLKQEVNAHTLVVVSSDFTHHGPNYGFTPFSDDIARQIEALDMGAVRHIADKDPFGFMQYTAQTQATICGRAAISVLLAMLPSEARPQQYFYTSSGAQMSDWQNSVSYLSYGFEGHWHQGARSALTQIDSFVLDATDKQHLLELARNTMVHYLKSGERLSMQQSGIPISPNMQQTMGAFVTLYRHDRLRGCIGEILPRRPLYQAVMDHAINALVNDTRFSPVTEAELPSLQLEISALTKPRRIATHDGFIVGRHGIVLSKRGRSAVFLPQVAPDQKWDKAQTLTHLAQKAGLSADDWKRDAAYEVFEAIVWSEENH